MAIIVYSIEDRRYGLRYFTQTRVRYSKPMVPTGSRRPFSKLPKARNEIPGFAENKQRTIKEIERCRIDSTFSFFSENKRWATSTQNFISWNQMA